MTLPKLDRCICNENIASTKPHCNKEACIREIVDRLSYMFDESQSKSSIIKFIENFPIKINKALINHESIDFYLLDEITQQFILTNPFIPIEFLLPLINIDFPKYLSFLQQTSQLKAIAKLIRRKKFGPKLLDRIEKLAAYFAIFLYNSREKSLWKSVLDTLIQSPFTPDVLLIHLDYFYRQNVSEYLQFYSKLKLNTKIMRLLSDIKKSEEIQESLDREKYNNVTNSNTDRLLGEEEKNNSNKNKKEELNKISGYQLNALAKHWFPEVRLAVSRHSALYKTTLIEMYNFEIKWKEMVHPELDKNLLKELNLTSTEEIKESPIITKLMISLIKHPKTPPNILRNLTSNSEEYKIQNLLVLFSSRSSAIVKKFTNSTSPLIQNITQFRLNWRFIKTINTNKAKEDDDENFFFPFPEQYMYRNFNQFSLHSY